MDDWKIRISSKAGKNIKRLPVKVNQAFQFLLRELELLGPIRGTWPNYGKLSEDCHHCHLKKGSPTYVAVWRVIDKKEKCIEVIYVGTHEKAHYDRLR